MRSDPRTLGWLNRALAHELGAVQQYLAQSVLARLWGETQLAEHLRREAAEELGHAEQLMERLILLGVAPSVSGVAPARLGRTVDQLLLANRHMEQHAVHLYQEALLHATRVRDGDVAALMQSILEEEKVHLADLDHMMTERMNHG
ncbi:MAG: ferritin-like domain-containing protein [Burkholderiaceae bacterium]|nr:ferritin-like domain-containing protein [Burkholderiaceae bacterium]